MGGVVVALVKGQPNRGVAPIAKVVGEKGATIADLLTDFEGLISQRKW